MTRRAIKPAGILGSGRLPSAPRQVVLVLQGGGALGAYQVGVYAALHAAGIDPHWVIGTSIGAINAALIAGADRDDRLARLEAFWEQVQRRGTAAGALDWFGLGSLVGNATSIAWGVPGFFEPTTAWMRGVGARVGIEHAAYYSVAPLRRTLNALVDLQKLNEGDMRLTVGAVNASRGTMRYFDSREQPIGLDHVLASGALPPAFPGVRIDGELYWDGGLYSNTPIEAVLDDHPRRDSLVFAVNMWHQSGPEPESIVQVMGRQKDIQYASRTDSHIARQKQIHHLRHVIRELARRIPDVTRSDAQVAELAGWGCSTTMHVAHLRAPRLDGEDHSKDMDFSLAGIRARREAGYADTMRMVERSPWLDESDPLQGIVEHDLGS